MSVTVTAAALGGTMLAKGSVPVNNVTPGVLGFLVVAAMGIALYFLLRSLSRQLKKIPPPPDDDGTASAAGASATSSAITGTPAPPGNRRK
jgi:hypothetical protein